jgi:hypothetical protein
MMLVWHRLGSPKDPQGSFGLFLFWRLEISTVDTAGAGRPRIRSICTTRFGANDVCLSS